MFDVSLTELMVIGVVALVVIGPERLPKVARTAGLLLGRLQRYVSEVKADINREMQLDELKKLNQQVSEQIGGIKASVTHEMREVESAMTITPPPAGDGAAPPAPTSAAPRAVEERAGRAASPASVSGEVPQHRSPDG